MTERIEAQLHDLSRSCAKISMDNGFEPTTWQNLPAYLMFVLTEVDEALHATSNEAFREEVADVAIRILIVLHMLWGDDWNYRGPPKAAAYLWRAPDLFGRLVNRVSCAAKTWRSGFVDQNADVRIYLEQALGEVMSIGNQFGFSVLDAMVWKSQMNATRPRLHGKVEVIG